MALAARMIDDAPPHPTAIDAAAPAVVERTTRVDSSRVGSFEREVRSKICDLLARGCRQRLLISTEGSLSARIDADSFVVTPTGMDRERIEPDDLVLVVDGKRQTHREPSRAVDLHAEIYARNPDVNAIAFAHPIHSTAFSITSVPLDSRTIPESYLVLGDILRVPSIGSPVGASELTSRISSRQPAAIIDNDGVAVVGKDLISVYDRLEVLEATAETLVRSRFASGVAPLPDDAIAGLQTAFGRL
jgi:L-fuculose-phosphate aldolase